MYCGMSLARVGLDIRGLLPPIFEACVLGLFSKVGTPNAFAHLHTASWFASGNAVYIPVNTKDAVVHIVNLLTSVGLPSRVTLH